MDIKRFRYLIDCYHKKGISPDEEQELIQLLTYYESQPEAKALINELWIESAETENPVFDKNSTEKIWAGLSGSIHDNVSYLTVHAAITSRRNVQLRNRWVWAAAFITVITVTLMLFRKDKKQAIATASEAENHTPIIVNPGTEGAILTLADGSQVVLDSLQEGKITAPSGEVIRLYKGMLEYESKQTTEMLAHNTVSTPRGRQFKLRLPDGSLVWLNAASSIRYPVRFAGSNRLVEITGEVFFDVEQDAKRPFIVTKDDLSVVVTGTTFNMNTYDDEKGKRITLVEGGVEVNKGTEKQVLQPGEQAVAGTRLTLHRNVDVNTVVAWKNGYFSFNNTYLQSLMRMIARWYDVEVEYEGAVPNMKFGGEISRTTTLDDVLNILRESKVRFRIEKKDASHPAKIIVSP